MSLVRLNDGRTILFRSGVAYLVSKDSNQSFSCKFSNDNLSSPAEDVRAATLLERFLLNTGAKVSHINFDVLVLQLGGVSLGLARLYPFTGTIKLIADQNIQLVYTADLPPEGFKREVLMTRIKLMTNDELDKELRAHDANT